MPASTADPQRHQQQDEHAKQRRPNGQGECARRSRLAFDSAAKVEEVTGRELELIVQNASDIRCRAAEIPTTHSRLDRDATRAGFATDRSGAKRLRHVSELSQWNVGPVMAIDQQGANRIERVPTVVPKAH
jgi:hypothetical protein